MKAYHKLYNTAGVIAGTGVLFLAGKASAAGLDKWKLITSDPNISQNIDGSTRTVKNTFEYLVSTIANYITIIAGVVAFVYLIWNGIKYITSNGDTKKAQEARSGIINAVIGIAIITAVYFIIKFASGLGKIVEDAGNNPAGL